MACFEKGRPLSPHLQVYRPQVTSVFSIFHRISGLSLYFILTFFCFLIFFSNIKVELSYINLIFACLQSSVGHCAIFVFILLFFYHAVNGIRHILWDAGLLFAIPCVTFGAVAVLLISLILTLFFSFLFLEL